MRFQNAISAPTHSRKDPPTPTRSSSRLPLCRPLGCRFCCCGERQPCLSNLTDNNCSGEGLGGQGYGAFSPPLPFSFFSCCTTFTFFLLPVWHLSHSPAMCEERRGTGGTEGGVPLKRRGEHALRCVRAWPGTGRPLQSNSLDSWIGTALSRCGWIVSRDNAHITPHGGIVAASSMQA